MSKLDKECFKLFEQTIEDAREIHKLSDFKDLLDQYLEMLDDQKS